MSWLLVLVGLLFLSVLFGVWMNRHLNRPVAPFLVLLWAVAALNLGASILSHQWVLSAWLDLVAFTSGWAVLVITAVERHR